MTSQAYSAPTSGWKVTSQTQGSAVGDDGRVVEGMMVGFSTGRGVAATVFVPWTRYNVQNVSDLINARAATLDAVHTLNG